MAGRTARGIARRMWETIAGDPSVMQILAGEIAHSILIDPHPRHTRGRRRGVAPHPMLTDSYSDLCVVSMLFLPYSTLQRDSLT
jgi:hypothetical protein